jgi:hypothetical protein
MGVQVENEKARDMSSLHEGTIPPTCVKVENFQQRCL